MVAKFENITIQNCEYAIDLEEGRTIINNVTLINNFFSIYAVGADIVMTKSLITRCTTGIYLEEGATLDISTTQISDNYEPYEDGAGIFAYNNSSVMATNCRFINNTAINGGSVYYETSSLNFSFCHFEDNFAGVDGGAMDLESGESVYFNNFSFVRNRANTGGGGAVYATSITTAIFINMTVDRCSSKSGAVKIISSTIEIHQSKIINNYRAGGMVVENSTLLITDSSITNNQDFTSGAGIYGRIQSNITMRGVTCSFNSAKDIVGCMVIASDKSLVAIQNCIIFSNSAEFGGEY